MKFKLDENLPASSAATLASASHDVDTVSKEGMTGAPDQDVVAAATTAGRILISLDVGMAGIRAYPPGSHAGIVVLRVSDQSAATVTKAIGDLAAQIRAFCAPAGRWDVGRVTPVQVPQSGRHWSGHGARKPGGRMAGGGPYQLRAGLRSGPRTRRRRVALAATAGE